MGTHLMYLLHFYFFHCSERRIFFCKSLGHSETCIAFPEFALLVRNRRKKGSFFPFRTPSGENGFKRREKGGSERRKRKVKFLPPSVFPFLRSSGFEFNRRCGGGSKEKGKGLLLSAEKKGLKCGNRSLKILELKLYFWPLEKCIYFSILVTAPGKHSILSSTLFARFATFTSADRKKRGKFLCARA